MRHVKRLVPTWVWLLFLCLPGFALAAPPKVGTLKTPGYNIADCYDCHKEVQGFHDGSAHKTVACHECHEGLPQHGEKGKGRPVTKTDSATCGSCHQNQYRTLYAMNWNKTAQKEKSLATGPSPDPAFDKLMGPHGFTREHNEPRSHAFALYDQLVVDRSFGGRYVDRLGRESLARAGGDFKIWDVLVNQYPGEPHKAFRPGTAAAATPVCMSCKTADHILDRAYLGDPKPKAKWSRLSKVNDFVKDTRHSQNCIFCPDPKRARTDVKEPGERAHAQDRLPVALRHQAAVRPVPR